METAIQIQVKASELRVGNWLYTEKTIGEGTTRITRGGRYIQVDEILQDGIGLTNNDGAAEYEWTDLQPIALTPELLVKCGFERIGEKVFTNEPFCFTMLKEGGFFFSLYGRDLCVVWHLHRLQNLIFELTSEELEVSFNAALLR